LYLIRNQNCAVALYLKISLCLKIDGSWFFTVSLKVNVLRYRTTLLIQMAQPAR